MSKTATTHRARMDEDRLYTGTGGIDFIGQSKVYYITAAVCIVISLGAFLFRGFDLSIDFIGGTKMNMPAAELSTDAVSQTFTEATGVTPELVQIVGAGDTATLEINSERLDQQQIDAAREAIFNEYKPLDMSGEPSLDAIGDSTVSENWGSTITNRMLISMLVFLVAAFIYIMLRLERDMAFAAMLALGADVILIPGIYSLFGFEVSPATVIGFLTVLSFSLYDTVIVFDKVRENTVGFLGTRTRTYAEQANLAVNQTVVRSISTTVISALPILALMVVAVGLLGVGTLKDLALIQLIGVVEGVFSSIFLATPLLVTIRSRQKDIREHNQKVEDFRTGKTSEVKSSATGREGAAADLKKASIPTQQTGFNRTWRPDQR